MAATRRGAPTIDETDQYLNYLGCRCAGTHRGVREGPVARDGPADRDQPGETDQGQRLWVEPCVLDTGYAGVLLGTVPRLLGTGVSALEQCEVIVLAN